MWSTSSGRMWRGRCRSLSSFMMKNWRTECAIYSTFGPVRTPSTSTSRAWTMSSQSSWSVWRASFTLMRTGMRAQVPCRHRLRGPLIFSIASLTFGQKPTQCTRQWWDWVSKTYTIERMVQVRHLRKRTRRWPWKGRSYLQKETHIFSKIKAEIKGGRAL